MIEKISKFLEIAYAILSIWLYKITIDKEKKADVKKMFDEADKAIADKRYDDVVIIWSRMRNV